MTSDSGLRRLALKVFHSLGLSCIGGAFFLQILVFSNILQYGYFGAIETNPIILGMEVGLTAFGLVYFIYAYKLLIGLVK